MKDYVIILIIFLLSSNIYGQDLPIGSRVVDDFSKQQIDTLRPQLDSLQASVLKFKKIAENIETDKKKQQSEINATKKQIVDKQVEAIRICAKYTDRFSHGTLAMDVILSSIKSNVSLGQLTSPFQSPKFKESYDGWLSKWGKYIPAIIVPSLSLLSKNEDFKVVSVSIGLSLTTLISALTNNSDRKRNQDFSNAIDHVTSTMDLFDFNRTVYDDIEKLKAIIKSVENSDSTFSKEFIEYSKANENLLSLSDDSIKNDPRFKKYIENSTIYFDRFQLKLARVNYVLDYAYGMIETYELRYNIITSTNINSNPVYYETKKSIDDLKKQYNDTRGKWNTLQSNFYKLTPTETRKLESFYQLEEILRNIK